MVKYMNKTELKDINITLETVVGLLSNINNLLYYIADDIQKKNETEKNKLVKINNKEKVGYGWKK
jgi:hypothetical protein